MATKTNLHPFYAYRSDKVKRQRVFILSQIRWGKKSGQYDPDELPVFMQSNYPNTRVAAIYLMLEKLDCAFGSPRFDRLWDEYWLPTLTAIETARHIPADVKTGMRRFYDQINNARETAEKENIAYQKQIRSEWYASR